MRKIYTGIDIGSDSIKIVVGEIYNHKMNVLASTSVRSNGIKKGIITNEELVVESLKEAVKNIENNIGVKIDKAITTVPANDRVFNVVSGQTPVLASDDTVTGEDIVSVLHEAAIDKVSANEELVSIVPITFNID